MLAIEQASGIQRRRAIELAPLALHAQPGGYSEPDWMGDPCGLSAFAFGCRQVKALIHVFNNEL